MDWEDTEEIVEALRAKHADVKDPFDISFPKLMQMVTKLEGFEGKVEQGRNYEHYLEAIQVKWAEECGVV